MSAQIDQPIRSPCISVCTLDEQDVCIGCWRTVDEIRAWRRMPPEQQRAVLVVCHARAAAAGRLL